MVNGDMVKEYMENIKFIRDNVPQSDRLISLAEECSELAKACLKIVRYNNGQTVSVPSLRVVKRNLVEELSDVMLCMTCIEDDIADSDLEMMMLKANRWKSRWKWENGVEEACDDE